VREQRRVPPHHDQDRGIDRGPRSEATGGQPPSPAELPPWAPSGADQVGGGTITDAHALTRDLPLHHEVGALESARGDVEQPVQDDAGHAERKVGHDAVRIGRKGHVASVGAQHDDVADRREPSSQITHELWIELHGEDVGSTSRERVGEDAATGAELDHPLVVADAGVRDELRRQPGATEEMLTEVPATAPTAGCVPGHGRPRP